MVAPCKSRLNLVNHYVDLFRCRAKDARALNVAKTAVMFRSSIILTNYFNQLNVRYTLVLSTNRSNYGYFLSTE